MPLLRKTNPRCSLITNEAIDFMQKSGSSGVIYRFDIEKA